VAAISIIVPFFNRHALIGECIDSAVAQSFSDFEVVIVDDGSTPALTPSDLGTGENDKRITIIRQDNRGSGAARNAALSVATGDYVLFLDSDDLLAPQALEALWKAAKDRDLDAVAGNWMNFSADGVHGHFKPTFPYADPLANVIEDGWATGCAILKRSLKPHVSEEKSRLPWDMAECYLKTLGNEALKIGYVDHDIVRMRQDSAGRLTVLYDHFDPNKAGRFWQEMKSSFTMNDERRSAFDRQLFRFAFSLFHAGKHSEASAIFSSIDVDRLTRYHWCEFLSPAWFVRWAGVRWGLALQDLAHKARRVVAVAREGRLWSAIRWKLAALVAIVVEVYCRLRLGMRLGQPSALPSVRLSGALSASPESARLKNCFEMARRDDSRLTPAIRSIEGMSGQRYRSFINNYVHGEPDARYLEIGSWAGSTATAALFGNKVEALCVDNWSEFGGPKAAFFANIELALSDQVKFRFLEKDFRTIDFGSIGRFNIYLFDGPHEKVDQYDGVMLAQPALDRKYLLVVDDWNWRAVRGGTLTALVEAGCKVEAAIEVRTTLDDSHPIVAREKSDWHNGYFLAVVVKGS
jgi:glycosyltransferase involved in cell wall biosynthesis